MHRGDFFRRLSEADEGFSLIEILAAFTLLAIVTLGTVPLLVSGLRSALTATLDTGAKNLSQQQFEQMRNLRFFIVSSNSGPPSTCVNNPQRTDPRNSGTGLAECDYKDLLDTYYRSTTFVATSTAQTNFTTFQNVTGGFVPATSTARASDEPSGAFYRFVINPVPALKQQYRQYIATQFLDASRNPVAPASNYNTQDSDTDFPPSRLVGVTVISVWQSGALQKKFVTFTQIAEGPPESPNVTALGKATALHFASGIDATRQLTMDAGISSSSGLIANDSSASTAVQSAFASISGGTRIDGRSGSAIAPPTASDTSGDSSPASLVDSGNEIACFTNGGISNVAAAILGDQPSVASAANQSLGQVKTTGGTCTGESNYLGFNNNPGSNSMPSLDLTKKMLRIAPTGSGATALGSSYINSTTGSGHFVEAGSKASSLTLKILPTSFAPNGVVQVTLTSASLVCNTNGSGATATGAFTASVAYFNLIGGTTPGYTTVNLTRGGANTLPTPSTVVVQAGVLLSSYIATWNALSVETTTSSVQSVTSSLAGIVAITTQPTRLADATSNIAIQVGNLSCTAEDTR